MGIQGLLPFVKKACRECTISEFSGCTIAVDACCWLHRGVFGCADKLARGEQTDFYVHYCMKYVNSLLSHGIRVILVFDGATLPAKQETNEARRQRRDQFREKGQRLLDQGNRDEANSCFRQGMNITFDMISDVIEACRALNRSDVSYIVAPYEADAQLAYLNINGYADVVLSEDSDLILFGCKKIVFKFDLLRGELYDQQKLPAALESERAPLDFATFRRACILSGCDYASGLPGFGLKKAMKFFRKVSSSSRRDIRKCLKRIPLVMNMISVNVTDDYVEQFIAAENTFLYQLVFDPLQRNFVPLNPYGNGVTANDFPYAGRLLDDGLAAEIATGQLCPHTHRRYGRSTENGKAQARHARNELLVKPAPKPPRKSRTSPTKAAFEVAHVRNVVRSRRSPKKMGSVGLLEMSSTISMYDSDANKTLSRSRYFSTLTLSATTAKDENGSETIHASGEYDGKSIDDSYSDFSQNSSQENRTPLASKKRTIFDVLASSDEISDESGFYDTSSSSFSATDSPDANKRIARKDNSFRFLRGADGTSAKLLESCLGTRMSGYFRYSATDNADSTSRNAD